MNYHQEKMLEKYEQVYQIVCEMICDAKDLQMSDLEPSTPLHQLEFDSLDYVELMVLAKREFDATLTPEMFIENPEMTLSELCQLVVELSGGQIVDENSTQLVDKTSDKIE